jgi:hypothetical protein
VGREKDIREYHDGGEDFPAMKSLLERNGVTFRHEALATALRLSIRSFCIQGDTFPTGTEDVHGSNHELFNI